MDPILCASIGDTEFFRSVELDILQNSKDKDGNSVLSAAVIHRQLSCCKMIASRCPDLIFYVNKRRQTPLHLASYTGDVEIISFLVYFFGSGEGDIESYGSSISKRLQLLATMDADARTALHIAVDEGHNDSARLLLKADTTERLLLMADAAEETAMHIAVKRHNYDLVCLLAYANPSFHYMPNERGHTPLFIAIEEASQGDPKSVAIRKFLIEKQPNQCMQTFGRNEWNLLHHSASVADISAMEEIMLFCPQCVEDVDNEGQTFLHIAVKYQHERVVKFILGHQGIETILNLQDICGNTALHIATKSGNVEISLSLLYDSRINKMIRNQQGVNALVAINFDYNKRIAGVFGLTDERGLRDQSDFDLLVGAIIATVTFTGGIAVPGGLYPDGLNQGTAILYKKWSFNAFVISNTLALVLSLFAVFSHYCTKRLISPEDIVYQLKVAAFCSLSSMCSMLIAFIMGSYTVLPMSGGLAITVCVICCFFFFAVFRTMWRLKKPSLTVSAKRCCGLSI